MTPVWVMVQVSGAERSKAKVMVMVMVRNCSSSSSVNGGGLKMNVVVKDVEEIEVRGEWSYIDARNGK